MSANRTPLIYLILARNEGASLERSLRALKAQLRRGDQVHVVADHCRDQTTEIAQAQGATVHVRHDNGPSGKAAALRWWVDRMHLDPAQPIILLDADSVILPGFAGPMQAALQAGAAAVQARLIAESEDDTRIGRLIALSERMDQAFYDRQRARIGGSVRLRGTGMGLRFDLLRKYAPMLHTKTEDIELTLLLAMDRVRVMPAFEARLIDPKPHIPEGAVNQRARWLQGQFQILRRYPGEIIRMSVRNPLGFSLVMSALIKPRSITSGLRWFVSGIILMGLLLWSNPVSLLGTAFVLLLLLNLLEVFALGFTLWTSSTRKQDFMALTALPAFLYLWVLSILRARFSRSPWLRVRSMPLSPGLNETATASQ